MMFNLICLFSGTLESWAEHSPAAVREVGIQVKPEHLRWVNLRDYEEGVPKLYRTKKPSKVTWTKEALLFPI